ncbi:hypothetical protein GCM10027589_33330 [Actinocorallia lasiicapitis]
MNVAPQWRKSSHSGAQGGDCVEVARLSQGRVGLRDSKNAERGHRALTHRGFAAFVRSLKETHA